jgi:hypothetical protein
MKSITIYIKGFIPLILMLIISLWANAAKKPVSPDSILTVTPTEIEMSSSIETAFISVTSNSEWTVASSTNWCYVSPSGSGDGMIRITCIENTSVYARVDTIWVTCKDYPPKSVKVTQAGGPVELTVSPVNLEIPNDAGTTTFYVKSNTGWALSSNTEWCTVAEIGYGNSEITAAFTENNGPDREATITVLAEGATPQEITLLQDGTTGIPEISENSLVIYPNPTNGPLSIIAGLPGDKLDDVTIVDLEGRKVFEGVMKAGQVFMIDLSANPDGYYYINVISNDAILTKEIVLDK